MPELRRDPIIGRWVIISTERANRPNQFRTVAVAEESMGHGEKCPFCEGNEHMTPPEIWASRRAGGRPNGPGWDVRVISSISPLLQIEGNIDRHGHGLYDIMNARGAHEIIVDTPRHQKETELSKDQLIKSFSVTVDRIADLEKDPGIKYVLVFRNYGQAAGGGAIKHSRLQIIGTPVNLKRVKEELTGSKRYFDYKDRCIYCDIIRQELGSGKRVMAETAHFVALAPFASRFPFEAWILPKAHSSDFYKIDRGIIPDLVDITRLVLFKTQKAIGEFPYNIVLHTAPFRRDLHKKGYWETVDRDYHWHFEVLPILTRVAGFEWGSGFYMNPIMPEDAAKAVREAEVRGE